MPTDTIINGRSYTQEYINDPRNQEEIRLAVVNGGNNIYNTSGNGLTHNTTGNTINANSTGGMTSTGSSYTNSYGTNVTPYSERNQIGSVLTGSMSDPNSANYSTTIREAEPYSNSGGSRERISGSGGGGSSSYSGSSSGSSQSASLTSLKDYQKQQAMSELGKARDCSLSNLGAEKSSINPAYYKKRADESTASQLGARNLAEYMASRGQSSAGASAQGEINRVGQLQGSMGNLDVAEQGELNANTRRVTDTNNAYNSDVASANVGIEATAMQQQIQANQLAEAQRIAQANADRQYNYQVGRDTVSDSNYANQNAYQQQQDLINQTGQLSNGQYTQSGQSNSLNIQQQQAQLAEMQNPNSTSNQMAKLGLDTAKLNYASLPQQLQQQAQQVVQQLRQGAIGLKTAQIQLDYLPQMMQQEVAQNNAQINATNRSNQSSSGSGSSGGSTRSGGNGTTKTQLTATQRRTETTKMAVAQEQNGTGNQWLSANAAEIKAIEGNDFFESLVNKIKKTRTDAQTAYNIAKAKAAQQNGNISRE